MDKSRLDTSRSGYREDVSNHSKKNKKRSSKRSSVLGSWMNSMQNNQNNDTVSGMEYQHVLWQSNVQQNIPNNGQRLFTTTSDPSMCGYAQMPMTYTMEPVSLPTMYRLYQPVPFSGVRPVHGRPRRHCNQNHPMNLGMNSMANGYTSLQENGMESPVPINYQNGDYASLPPTANKNNGMNGDELNSEHRRYSDPGLGSAEAPVHAPSEDSDSVDSGSSITTIGRGNKLVLSLIEQMTELKKSNSQLFKELNETKSELGSMKAKLAQCKYSNSTDYQPGMLSDFIREIRQANKACEEGLVSKVMSMVEEKLNQRSLEMVNLNNQIMKLMEEKEESDRRIAKLEEEVATLKLNANNEGREIAAFEEETLGLRRELQEARASKCLAEIHVAKCVNARSVTPVATFDTTTPYVTSTPVRTALSDTCSLIPAPPSSSSSSSSTSSSSSSSSSVPQHFTSILRSRIAEVAHHFVTGKQTVYRIADCSSPTPMDASWTMDDRDQVTSSGNRSPVVVTNTQDTRDAALEETSNIVNLDIPSSDKAEDCKQQEDDQSDVQSNDKTLENTKNNNEVIVPTADENQIDSTVENSPELNSGTISSSVVSSEKRTKVSKKEDYYHQHQHQRMGSKKQRKKKNGSLLAKRSFSEADKAAATETLKNGTRDVRRTVSEDKDRLDGDVDETSRAITEIPEVTVVGGGSFVPKDLCSTGILTSRVLTAPSRATYTTAYI
ncbi:PREDICTED: serine-rich adhesin for platelets isoform X1 [Habropoda laboriosa]|uniref:serine-rich adhesin for platelets isoform X1 n=1 Tax=Habropoda laboriosa TaxID=597456 RepID=UPI00083DED72|nr:PREDICTED: serine-rich adhesin for platelets isoform X1 [Habropoda laboriosa]